MRENSYRRFLFFFRQKCRHVNLIIYVYFICYLCKIICIFYTKFLSPRRNSLARIHTVKIVKCVLVLFSIYLPRSPELNSQENVWQYIKDHSLTNRIFKNIEEIIDACSGAWNCFASSKKLIMSLIGREWDKIL